MTKQFLIHHLEIGCPKLATGLDQAVTESQNCSFQEFSQLSHKASQSYYIYHYEGLHLYFHIIEEIILLQKFFMPKNGHFLSVTESREIGT